MLGRLLKYEMKAMGRVMLPLYAVVLGVAVVLATSIRLSLSSSMKSLLEKFAIITSILFICAVMAAFVVMAIITIQRFYRNLLGTEGYLMFTLPVTTLQNILSKAISSLIWIVAGIVTGGLSGLLIVSIVSDLPEFMREIRMAWDTLLSMTSVQNATLRVVLIIVMIVVGILESLFEVYAAIAVGHQWGSHRLLGSVLAYMAFGMIELLLSWVFRKTIGAGLDRIFDMGTMDAVIGFILVGLLGAAVYCGIAWYLLDRRLNLE